MIKVAMRYLLLTSNITLHGNNVDLSQSLQGYNLLHIILLVYTFKNAIATKILYLFKNDFLDILAPS